MAKKREVVLGKRIYALLLCLIILKRVSALSLTKDVARNSAKETSRSLSARAVAIDASIRRGKGPRSSVSRLTSHKGFGGLETRDKAFSRLLVSTTERRHGQIEKVLSICRNKKGSKKKQSPEDLLVESTLRIGAAQLLFLDVMDHAAVKETVDVLRVLSKTIPDAKVKFVNAILRRITRERVQLLDQTSVADNVNPWLMYQLQDQWGAEAATLLVNASMSERATCISVKGSFPKSPEYEFLNRLRESVIDGIHESFPGSTLLSLGSLRISAPPTGPICSWPYYEDGLWWVQDTAASIPALALAQEMSKLGHYESKSVADLCAAPGGKTAQLSNLGFQKIVAVELSSKRMQRLKENMSRLSYEWDMVNTDASNWFPSEQFNGILVDVPCSATGTACKNPDVLQTTGTDLAGLIEIQHRLACHASSLLTHNGVMVYSTCSVLRQESEDQVQRLLESSSGATLELIPFQEGELPSLETAIDKAGCIRTLPGTSYGELGTCDGFFLAKLRRVK